LRLLLDEHYSPRIAEELRVRGHDTVSAAELDEVRGSSDRDVWNRAIADERALVTENVADYMALVREFAGTNERHFGVIFTSPRSLPRGLGTIGAFVELLDELLIARSAADATADQVYWLAR
jgi:hypothetical protein